MERKYDESYYLMDLEQVVPKFSKPVLRRLKENGITTLGELFDLYDDNKRINEIYPKKSTSESMHEFIGTTKLLRYKYLREDLQLKKHSDYIDFGFSGRALSIIISNGWKMGRTISNYERILRINNNRTLNSDGVGTVVRDEIISKCSILKEYSDEKNLINGNDDEVSILNRKLKLLEKKKELLEMQIEELKEEIKEKSIKKR